MSKKGSYKCILTSDNHYWGWHKVHKKHEAFWERVANEEPDLVFLAGDMIADKQKQLEQVFEIIRKHLPDTKVYFVHGNHDFWDGKPSRRDAMESNPFEFLARRRRKHPSVKPRDFNVLWQEHKDLFEKYNIFHLDGTHDSPRDDLIIAGYDGWYQNYDLNQVMSNDYKYLPDNIESVPAYEYLAKKAHNDLGRILDLDTDGKTSICMTHFSFKGRDPEMNSNPRYLDFITEKFDFLLYGHSHRYCDEVINECRVLNSGSDYDDPKHIVFYV